MCAMARLRIEILKTKSMRMDKVISLPHHFQKYLEGIKQVTKKIRFGDKYLISPIKRKVLGRGGIKLEKQQTQL